MGVLNREAGHATGPSVGVSVEAGSEVDARSMRVEPLLVEPLLNLDLKVARYDAERL